MLAAVAYHAGFPIDDFMVTVAATLRAEKLRLRGVVQHNVAGSSCPAMALVDLATGKRCGISQELGPHARGCRLDPHGLAAVAAMLDASTAGDVDLLILNKFGKAEAEGGGFRDAFACAIEAGIPVLTAVRPPYAEDWYRFHGGLAAELEPRLDAVLAWCHAAAEERRGAARAPPERLRI